MISLYRPARVCVRCPTGGLCEVPCGLMWGASSPSLWSVWGAPPSGVCDMLTTLPVPLSAPCGTVPAPASPLTVTPSTVSALRSSSGRTGLSPPPEAHRQPDLLSLFYWPHRATLVFPQASLCQFQYLPSVTPHFSISICKLHQRCAWTSSCKITEKSYGKSPKILYTLYITLQVHFRYTLSYIYERMQFAQWSSTLKTKLKVKFDQTMNHFKLSNELVKKNKIPKKIMWIILCDLLV